MNPRRRPSSQHPLFVSAERLVVRHDSGSTIDAIQAAVRGALQLAIIEAGRVAVVLRGDPVQGRAARVIEGVPYEIATAPDGRERVYLRIAEGSEQVVLLERIIRVMAAGESG